MTLPMSATQRQETQVDLEERNATIAKGSWSKPVVGCLFVCYSLYLFPNKYIETYSYL